MRIITFGEDALSGTFRVDASGEIALPLVGVLDAAGLTPRALGQEAAEAMRRARLLRNPQVAVEVEAYRPVFVLGEVARPGQYPYQPGMSVVTAVAVAGGFTYRAVQDEMSVVRGVNGTTIEGRAERQTPVAPGDVITVFERRF